MYLLFYVKKQFIHFYIFLFLLSFHYLIELYHKYQTYHLLFPGGVKINLTITILGELG